MKLVTWNTTTVLSYSHRVEYGLHEDIPDLAKLIEICLIMSRSQSDTERVGKLTKDVSDKRFGGKYNEAHKEKGKKKGQIKKHLFMQTLSPCIAYHFKT